MKEPVNVNLYVYFAIPQQKLKYDDYESEI